MKDRIEFQATRILLLAVICGCGAACYRSGPAEFVSKATLMVKSGGGTSAGAIETEIALLEGDEVRRRSQARVEATHPDLKPVPVKIEAKRVKKSELIVVKCTGGEPGYVQVYLDAVLKEFVNFRKELEKTATTPWDAVTIVELPSIAVMP